MTTEVLDPTREIVDPHHHLWSENGKEPYLLDDLYDDLRCGHNVVQTVFVECRTHYHTSGPDHLHSVGETEWVESIARTSANGPGPEIVGIVAFADLSLDSSLVSEALEEHRKAANGLLRGIRHPLSRAPQSGAEPGPALATEQSFRDGVRLLGQRGLTYESYHYHYQMDEFIALARSAPETTVILDHFGFPRPDLFEVWKESISEAAKLPNIAAKLGGMAMPANGFGWHEREKPVTAKEFVLAQRDFYLHTIDQFGPDRCMFESNFPVDKVSVSYRVLYDAFKLMTTDFSESDKNALFNGTARQIYGLPAS